MRPESTWQQRVADFARRHSILHDPVVHALDLASEVGEVAKEVLLATDYGHQAVSPRPQLGNEFGGELRDELGDELGDALYSLLVLAEACGVDAGAALDAALEKYERRLAKRGKAGSR